jgi:long-chain fatty acid transport protein
MSVVVAIAATFAWSATASAGGFSNPDFGIRRLGMFAITAKADDPTAIFHNPAGLTLQEGTHLYHAQSWFFLDLGMKLYDSKGVLRPDHEISPDWSIAAIPFLGVASDLGTENLRIGFGVYAPNAYGAALPEDEPTRYHGTRVLFLAPRATASVAYKFHDMFSVGLSVNVVYVTIMAKRYMNKNVLEDPDRRFDPPDVTKPYDAKLEIHGSDWTWAWDVGLMFTPIETLRFGLAFSSGSTVTLRGPVDLTYPDGTVESSTQTTDMTIPFELKFGFNWEFVKDFELGADIYWWHYQTFQEQRTVLSKPIMGLPGFTDPKNYGNSWAWNVGLMYRVLPELELMAGWQMDFTPIPSRTYTLDNPSTDQKGVSLGIRWQVSENVRIGAAMVRNWFDMIDVQDSQSTPPSNGKGHGANFEFGFDIDWRL